MTAAAFEKPILHYTLPAAADLSAKQYYCCKLNTTPAVALCSVAGERVDGVLQNEPASAEHAMLMVAGITNVQVGGTVAAGDSVMTNSSGKVVAATGGMWAIGTMLQAGVIGDVKALFVKPHFVPSFSYTFPVDLATIADGDVVTTFTPGFAGKIEGFDFVTDVPVTTAAKTTALNLEIGTTNLAGGVLTITSAAATPQGAIIASTAITAANSFAASDTISVEASSTTTFIEGSGSLIITGSHRAA